MKKNDLRNIYKQKRAGLTVAEKDKLEDLMLIQFQKLDIEIPALMMTYAPIEKMNEFNPKLITDYCYFKNPAQTLFYPVIDTLNDIMDCVVIDDHTIFDLNKWGILQPVNGLPVFAEEIDLIMVPLLAFDEQGNRVGYGKGYYDRFLKECRKDIVKIGFSFFEPEKKITDVNKFDVKLDYCITPQKIYQF